MKYRPGSFSKNFGWQGTGLRKLHNAVNAGFRDTMMPVERAGFRESSGLDASLSLIPINFFFHNRDGRISVDELVFQAMKRPHSIRFDRIGLFALHLNRAGAGNGIVERPAMWANEFVRDRLWIGGAWRSSALADASIDPFIKARMDAQNSVRLKCRNNYRHLFTLCQFWPTPLPFMNPGTDQWIASALFLTWDRHILDGGASDQSSLLALVESEEIYKLLGMTRQDSIAHATDLVRLYVEIGCLDRFDEPGQVPTSTQASSLEVPEEDSLEWIDQRETDDVIGRRSVERWEQKRNRKKAAALKKHYNNTCMFCGSRLQVAGDRFYSEAAHIKGVGEPHNGPDKAINMLVLCPNHHLQFDRGVLRLQRVGDHYQILSIVPSDPLEGKRITLTHHIDDECVKYHRDWFNNPLLN